MVRRFLFNFAAFNKSKLIEIEKLFQYMEGHFYALTSLKKYDIGVLSLAYIVMVCAFLQLTGIEQRVTVRPLCVCIV